MTEDTREAICEKHGVPRIFCADCTHEPAGAGGAADQIAQDVSRELSQRFGRAVAARVDGDCILVTLNPRDAALLSGAGGAATPDPNDGGFTEAAYCHHRHHLDEHSSDFLTCPHRICSAARRAASAAGAGEAERPPNIGDLVTCSLRDPEHVCHIPRLDCQHEGPHLIAACGAFMAPAQAEPAKAGEAERLAADKMHERLLVTATALDLEYPSRKRAITDAIQTLREAAAVLRQQAEANENAWQTYRQNVIDLQDEQRQVVAEKDAEIAALKASKF